MATEIMISQQLWWPKQEDQANQNSSIDEAEDLQGPSLTDELSVMRNY